MVSSFIAPYFVLWLTVRTVGQSHERRPGGKSREEASRGDEEDEVRDGGRSQEENEGGSRAGQGRNTQQQPRRRHQ